MGRGTIEVRRRIEGGKEKARKEGGMKGMSQASSSDHQFSQAMYSSSDVQPVPSLPSMTSGDR